MIKVTEREVDIQKLTPKKILTINMGDLPINLQFRIIDYAKSLRLDDSLSASQLQEKLNAMVENRTWWERLKDKF